MKKSTYTPKEEHGINVFSNTLNSANNAESMKSAYQYIGIIWLIALVLFLASNSEVVSKFFAR
jgi:hypothetical protein